MSSSGTRSASLGGIESQTASAVEREAEDANSKPSYVEWKAKFVDRVFDLGYDETEGSICKFVTTYCNLQANIDVCTWWKEGRKWIPTYLSCLRNDKSTAMKWDFLGTYYLVYNVLSEIKRG
jgi:hypothetical protein